MAFVNNNGMHQSSTTIADNELWTSENIIRRLERILLNWIDETHTILDKFKADLKSDLKVVLRQSISAMVDASFASSLEPVASSTLSDFLPTTPNQEKESADPQEFIRFHESISRIDSEIVVPALDIEEFGSVDKVLEEGTVVVPSKCQEIALSTVVQINENPCLGVYKLFDEMSRRDLEVFDYSKHIGSKECESYFNEVGGILFFDPGGLNSIEFLANLSAQEVFVETPQRKVLSIVTRGSVLELIAYHFPYDRGKYKLLMSSEDESAGVNDGVSFALFSIGFTWDYSDCIFISEVIIVDIGIPWDPGEGGYNGKCCNSFVGKYIVF